MKIGSIGYVPPPTFPGAQAFVENVHKFKPGLEMILLSNHKDYGFIHMENPEEAVGVRDNPRWGINNAIFVTCLQMAARFKFTHILYLEADCRVGREKWDVAIFDEYFSLPFPPVAAGSLVAHGCVNGGLEFYERFTAMISANYNSKQFRIPIYGIPVPFNRPGQFPVMNSEVIKPGDNRIAYKPAVYPNGALGIYDMAWMKELFGINDEGRFKEGSSLVQMIQEVAWDHAIGLRLYDRFGPDVFSVVAHLNSVYSSYGNKLSTESDRLDLLLKGRAIAVHQVKSEARV